MDRQLDYIAKIPNKNGGSDAKIGIIAEELKELSKNYNITIGMDTSSGEDFTTCCLVERFGETHYVRDIKVFTRKDAENLKFAMAELQKTMKKQVKQLQLMWNNPKPNEKLKSKRTTD